MAVVLAGGISVAWPAWWLRVPGPLVEHGQERGTDKHIIAAADWAKSNLPADSRVAADLNGGYWLVAWAGMARVPNVDRAYFTPTMDITTLCVLRSADARYIWTDRRMNKLHSVDGAFFTGYQSVIHDHPSTRALTKFERDEGVSEVYSDGTISIYDVRAAISQIDPRVSCRA